MRRWPARIKVSSRIVAVVMGAGLTCPASAESLSASEGYGNVLWGMSEAQVEVALSVNHRPSRVDSTGLRSYTTYLHGLSCEITPRFWNDSLTAVMVRFQVQNHQFDSLRSHLERLTSILTSDYGPPSAILKPGRFEAVLHRQGDLKNWVTGESEIILILDRDRSYLPRLDLLYACSRMTVPGGATTSRWLNYEQSRALNMLTALRNSVPAEETSDSEKGLLLRRGKPTRPRLRARPFASLGFGKHYGGGFGAIIEYRYILVGAGAVAWKRPGAHVGILYFNHQKSSPFITASYGAVGWDNREDRAIRGFSAASGYSVHLLRGLVLMAGGGLVFPVSEGTSTFDVRGAHVTLAIGVVL